MFDAARSIAATRRLAGRLRSLQPRHLTPTGAIRSIKQISSPNPSQHTYAMWEPSGAQAGPPSVNSGNRAFSPRRRSSGWVNCSAPESRPPRSRRLGRDRCRPDSSRQGTRRERPQPGTAESRLEPASSRARRNKPSSLPQATELSVGDHTGIPAGSPILVSAPSVMRTANTPCLDTSRDASAQRG